MTAATDRPLCDFIGIGPRFVRSINLEKDYLGGQRNGDYIITPNARDVLSRVAESLRTNSPHRAWTITGPYGVGKSAFGVFLARLICPTDQSTVEARRQLQAVDPPLAARLLNLKVFERPRKGLFPIPITARRAATSACILEGIAAAASRARERQFHDYSHKLKRLIRQAERDRFLDSSVIVNALAGINTIALKNHYSGAILLIDELGKLFEFAARSPQKADIFLLQQLAEYAARSADNPLLLIGFLHQSFEDYGQHLDSVFKAIPPFSRKACGASPS